MTLGPAIPPAAAAEPAATTTVSTSADVSALLPTVPEGYEITPSLAHLRALASASPALLQEIHDFKVSRPGVGSVHFLQAVDVTALDVGATVLLVPGEVIVYPEEGGVKPPVGEALNRPAQIKLLHVDKKLAGRKDAAMSVEDRTARIRKRLQKHCTTVGAAFVSYTQDGTWTFEVEHFSRHAADAPRLPLDCSVPLFDCSMPR